MGRKLLNHVQYKRNIHPDFVDKMDKHLNKLKETEPIHDYLSLDEKNTLKLNKK